MDKSKNVKQSAVSYLNKVFIYIGLYLKPLVFSQRH